MKKYIEISDEQIEFLKAYPHPWSFLGKRVCELPEWMDAHSYTMLSIRVASICIPKIPSIRVPKFHFPLFLTSANLSGYSESKTLTEARVFFPSVEGIDGGVCDRPPSDIFSL